MAVYHGQTLNDEKYLPYLKVCEEYNIPVAYHTGGTFPGANATIWKKFRLSFGNPLLIEDVLVRYPRLKLSLMHAGSNFYENTLRMMDQYPQLYADLGVLLWLHPMEKDYAVKFLESAKKYGLLDRVMFGSDQMIWPDSITASIRFLDSLSFLTEAEKRDILYHNAKRFLNKGE
nr:amidohydrolase family protein [Lewinella sp. JB7]